jgi:hypothetical protein
MFGFPPILNGNAGIKFTKDADSGFPKPGIREIFYSIKDGNWTDTTVWQTASGRVGLLPTANDDVYVRHTISGSGGAGNAFANTLYITPNGTLSVVSYTFIINNIVSNGIINVNTNVTFNILNGSNSYIDKTKQTAAAFGYVGQISQPIIDANYTSLAIAGRGEKYLTCDLTVDAYSSVNQGNNCWLNFKNFNFTCNTTFSNANGAPVYCDGNGYLLFKGVANFNAGFYCNNAPTIEFQNGIGTFGQGGNTLNWTTPYSSGFNAQSYLGTGLIKFTTNSQSVLGGGGQAPILDNTITIDNGITLTIATTGTTSTTLMNTINGLGATSRLVNAGILNFGTATAATTAMSTGLFDFTTNANTIGYTGNYSATIPSYFTTFSSLLISGTGTKTTSVNTTVNSTLTVQSSGNLTLGGNLTAGGVLIQSSGTLQCAAFDLNVLGATTLPNGSLATLAKSGAGNITFNGLVTLGQLVPGFNFSGNPNVEFKAGLSMYQNPPMNTGTGQWKFSTVSQTVNCSAVGLTFNCSILISGAITVTFINAISSTLTVNNTIDGDNAGSVLNIGGTTFRFTNTSFLTPMSTFGTFIITGGVINYAFNGSITLPYTSYGGLTIEGTGIKTLAGNTTLTSDLIFPVNSNGTLQCSTFDLTVGGITNSRGTTSLLKNGAGNLIFIGNLNVQGGIFTFNGNPNVEMRGGAVWVNPGSSTIGNGTYTFSTNNQSLDTNGTLTFNNIVIGNNVILSYTCSQGNFSTITIIGTMNGSNATSTFRMGTGSGTPTINYQNTVQPMATGVLDTSTNLNTFIYGAGNQDVKGGTPQQYRNLRFSGSGTTKTLQGNINVQNTYTVDAGVTVNLNGFTKTP